MWPQCRPDQRSATIVTELLHAGFGAKPDATLVDYSNLPRSFSRGGANATLRAIPFDPHAVWLEFVDMIVHNLM
jgi:hypothetical protein